MLALFTIFIGSFVLALTGAMMPGPLLTVTIAESTRGGFKAGPLLITGHGVLELLLVIAIVRGFGTYLKSPHIMGIIAILGGGILVWMGIDMLRNSGTLSLSEQNTHEYRKTHRNLIMLGVLASLSNPYWTLWWATIGLGYLITAMKYGTKGLIVFFLGHIFADYAWYALVSLGISQGKRVLRDKSYQLILRICGFLLVGFGGWFLLSAGKYLSKVPPISS